MKPIISKYMSMTTYELLKGAITAFISALIAGLIFYMSDKQSVPTSAEFQKMLIVAATTLLAYIKVKLFTNSEGKLLTKEPPPTETK